MLSLTGKNWVIAKMTQEAICLAVNTRFKIANQFCTSFCFALYSRTVYTTSLTCVFPGLARHFQFNFFWLLKLIIDVRVQEQPVLPQTVGGGHPNLAVGAGGPSFHSRRPSSATGERRDNQLYSFIFQAGTLF